MTDWISARLSDLTDIKTGRLDSNAAVNNGQYPFFTCSPETLTINDYAFDCNAVLLAGNNANGVFSVKKYNGKFNAYQRTYVITPKNLEILDVNFLFYFISTLSTHLTSQSIGTATKFLTRKILDPLLVPLPELSEQKAISSILNALDSAIENNQMINETLEAMVRSTYKDWFVDFGPTRAKMEGREPYLAADLWALFPNRLNEEGIPEGWEEHELGFLGEVTIGGLWGEDTSSAENDTEFVCLRGVDLQHLREGGYASKAPRRFGKARAIENRLPGPCDVLIASSGAGPCGRPLWIGKKDYFSASPPIIYSNFVKRISCLTPAHACFLDRILYEMRLSGEISAFIVGTSVPNLNDKSLLSTKRIIIPPEQILNEFLSIANLVQEALFDDENQILAETRDLLLPKLMSGEIRVKYADLSI